ncbi:MAG: gliding motility-associated C-terminal domain-containing protein [Bacteroidia bacterium]|nr:gliding motility-associated C-terminal domain-containing protein [Bacteroidia bacterium]
MKKILLFLFYFIGVYFFCYNQIFGQCNNCNAQYPSATQSTTSATMTTISTCMYGGEYAVCNVTAGQTYNWQTCGDTDFDTQLTLQQGTGCSGTDLVYNDDGCSLQSTITWTATFTGTVSVLVSQYNCVTNSTCMTLQWACTSCGGGGGGSCPGAPSCSTSPPANDNCNTPTPICEFEGYCGNTSTSYTAGDIPAGFCGSVENNSWLSFTASATSATLNIYVCNCTWGDGIQMEIYETNNCNAFTSHSNCWNPAIETNGTVTATGLTVGNDYLLMIDGFAGDDCDYTISAASGIWQANAIVTQSGTSTYSMCLGQSANLLASGGTAYSWTPTTGLSNPNIANPVATPTTTTTYTCSVTGGNPLCPGTNTVSVTITVTPGLTLTPSSTNPSCNGGSNGTATVTVSGGAAPYTYVWNDPPPVQTTATATGLSAGTYTVTVTSSNGCSNTTSVTLTNPPLMTVSLTPAAATCGSSNGSISCAVSNGTPNYTFACTGQTNATNQASPYTFSNLAPGTYTVTATSSTGCTATATTTITTTGSVTATFTYNGNHCVGGTAYNFTNTGTSGGIPAPTYSWTFPSGTPSTSTQNNPIGITWSAAGTYTVTHTITQGTCNATQTMVITVYPNPAPNVNVTNIACSGSCTGVATANPTGGSSFTYVWSTGPTTQAITNLCAGTYTVTVTNSDNCQGTQTVTITQPAPLILVTTRTDATCYGLCNGTANVTASGGSGSYTYNWSGGSTPSSPGTSALCVGNYTVTVTDASAPTCQQTASVTIGQPSDIILTMSTTNAACGNPTGTATVNVTNGNPPITYVWSTAPPQTGQTATGLAAGAYTVTVTANGCTKTGTANVGSTGGPTISIASSTNINCNGQSTGSATASAPVGGAAPFVYQWDAGTPPLNQLSVNGLSSGTHTITVTDNNGCTATASVTITQPAALTATTSPVGANCGLATGSIQANPNGGISPYTYSWNSAPVQTTQIATALPPGTYTVTVTDNNNCTTTASGTISNLPGVAIAVKSTTNITCNGLCNGTASLESTGGIPSYIYTVSAPSGYTTTTASLNVVVPNLCAGTYSVTVQDGNNCQATASFTITQPPAMTASISSSSNVSCNGGNNGSATATGIGGTGPYTGVWNTIPSQASLTALNLTAGTYSVTVTDANGCTANTTVAITQPAALSLTTNKTNAHCGQADGTASVAAVGGTTGYTYQWSGGTPPLNQPMVNGLLAGSYTVTVTDNNNCTATATVTITDIPGGSSTISAFTNVTCNGLANGLATVSMGGGLAPFTYLWNTVPAQTTVTASNLGPGTYTVSVTDANNCVATSSVTIIQPAAITNTFNQSNTTCFGQCNGSLSANPSGGTSPYTYQWSNFQTIPSITGLCAGVYTVSIIDSYSCMQSFTTTVTQPAQIVLTNVVTNAHCNQSDGAIDLTVSGGSAPYLYHWSSGEATQDLSGKPSGTFAVTVTDANLCTSNATIQINNISGPTASITASQNVQCFGANDGFATVTGNGGTLSFSYLWNTTPAQMTQTATNLGPGIYSVTVTDINTNCTVNASVTITEPAVLTMNINTHDVQCNGQCNGSANVVPFGGTPPYTFLWNTSPSSTNDTVTGLCAGSYTVVITDANACIRMQTVTINQPPFIAATTSSSALICNGVCNGTATANPNGGTPPYGFTWSANANNQTTQQAVALCPGTYTVTVSDSYNCTTTANATVTSPPPLNISLVDLQHVKCFGEYTGRIILSVTGGTPGYSYAWSNGATTQNLINISYGTYCVTVSDNNSCSKDTCFIISQPPLLNLSLTAHEETCWGLCNGYVVPNVLGGQPPYTYLWSNFDTHSTADSLCPGVFSLTVTDFNNCTASAIDTVIGHDLLGILMVNTDTATCGQANGSATISVIGGTWNFSYHWPVGVNSNSCAANNLLAGSYTVTVIDQNGCRDSLLINISNAAGPVIDSIHVDNVSCNGYCDGSLQVYYTSSTTTNTITWTTNPQQTGSLASNLCPGTYSVIVTDANLCATSTNRTVTQPSVLQSAVTNHTDVSCYGACNGNATAMANGGVQPYIFTWSNSSVGGTATALCAGVYTVTAMDAHSCTSICNITITQPDSIHIDATVTDVTCNGAHNGQILLNVSGGTGYVYNWFPNVSSNSVAAPLQPGSYTVIVSDYNDLNCTVTATYAITEPNLVTVVTDYAPTTCGLNNGMAYISGQVQGGTAPYSYVWTPGNITNDTVYNASAGTYHLQIIDSHNCTSNSTVVVSSQQPPVLNNLTVTNISCPGANDGLAFISVQSGSQPYSYTWSPFIGNDSIVSNLSAVIYGLSAGTYNVTITDNDGCHIQTVFIITQPSPITIHADGERWICIGQNATISASASGGTPPYTFQWIGLPQNTQVQVVNPTVTTMYPVYGVDSRGCISDTVSVIIHVFPPITIDVYADTNRVCKGNTTALHALPTGGNGGPYNYVWSDIQPLDTVPFADRDVSPIDTTTYYVYAIDGCGSPSNQDSVTIIVLPVPQVAILVNKAYGCEPLEVFFNNIGTMPNITYLWNFHDPYSNNNVQMDRNPSHLFTQDGTYNVTLLITTSDGCTASANKDIIVYPKPNANFIADPWVASLFHSTIKFFDESGDDIVHWQWNFGDNRYSGLQNPEHTYEHADSFNVQLIVRTLHGCIDSITQIIEIRSEFTLYVPTAFDPNSPVNREFYPQGEGFDEKFYHLYIYDRWGELIFETTDFKERWSGKPFNNGSEYVKSGTYVWYIWIKDIYGKAHEKAGTVTVIR